VSGHLPETAYQHSRYSEIHDANYSVKLEIILLLEEFMVVEFEPIICLL